MKLQDVQETVQAFLDETYPEIAKDANESGVSSEIAQLLYDMLTGDDDT